MLSDNIAPNRKPGPHGAIAALRLQTPTACPIEDSTAHPPSPDDSTRAVDRRVRPVHGARVLYTAARINAYHAPHAHHAHAVVRCPDGLASRFGRAPTEPVYCP